MASKKKTYTQLMDSISSDKLFEGLVGHGLFPEKVPPIFTSKSFYDFCLQANSNFQTSSQSQYIFYESMRNTNVPRMMGIPNPFAYATLCLHLKNYWPKIREYFKNQTDGHSYKKSRIHIRDMKGKKNIFQMNYNKPDIDENPETDLLFNAHYVVYADISQCFPSMYSHALSWAIVSKTFAKAERDPEHWYNKLDFHTRNIKDGETNGFLIGPHVSNLLSEIILTTIDAQLNKWNYVRRIDDFSCFVKTQADAEAFLVDLNMALKEFGLSLNHKKTQISKLPMGQEESWVRKLNNYFSFSPYGQINNKQIHAFLDFLIDLFKETNNSAVILYAMKMLAKRNIDEKGRQHYVKIIFHLALIYPYLFPHLDEFLFIPFDVPSLEIKKLSSLMYENGIKEKNAESISYSIYFAIKYCFEIDNFNIKEIISISDCVLNTLVWKYSKINNISEAKNALSSLAESLSKNDFDLGRHWVFVYEVLPHEKLNDQWACIKKKKVTFLLPEKEVFAKTSPDYELMPCNFDLQNKSEAFDELLGKIWQEFSAHQTLENGDNKKYLLGNIILNLFIAFLNRKNVTIPKSKDFYLKKYEEKGDDIGLCANDILNWLRDNCYIGERLGNKQDGYSSYWAKPKLYSKFTAITSESITGAAKYSDCVVLKDKDGNILDSALSEKGLSYKSILDVVNDFYNEHRFSYSSISDRTDLLFPCLTAIFNDNSWDIGGRLYSSGIHGISYQSIPSDIRETFYIDGEKTVEIDYSGMHISMLYAKEAITPPADPYDFLSGDERSLAKYATIMLLNADDENQVIFKLQQKKEEMQFKQGLSRKKSKLKNALNTCSDFSDIVQKIKSQHMSIAKYFCTGIGKKLQNIDSIIALEIINHFCKLGIPVLPMHDSFIIASKHKDQLKTIMDSTFKKHNNNFTCNIK